MLVLVFTLSTFTPVEAKEGSFYGIISGGYASNDFDGESFDEASYKVGLGYQLAKQWNIELGFQALGEDRLDLGELNHNNASQEVVASYVSALGRAGNRHGELFYRIGLLRADISEDYLSLGAECHRGGSIMAAMNDSVLCQRSESNMAAVLGVGFDFYIHHSTLLRLEIEHIQGQDGFSAQAVYIGFRLNF